MEWIRTVNLLFLTGRVLERGRMWKHQKYRVGQALGEMAVSSTLCWKEDDKRTSRVGSGWVVDSLDQNRTQTSSRNALNICVSS